MHEADNKIRSLPEVVVGDDAHFVRSGYRSLMYQALLDVTTALLGELRHSTSDDPTKDLSLGLETLYDTVAQLLHSSRSMAEAGGDWNFLHEKTSPEARNTSPKRLLSENLMDTIMHSSIAHHQSNILDGLINSRHPGTSRWFFESQPYIEWRKGSYRILLIEGLRQYRHKPEDIPMLTLNASRLREVRFSVSSLVPLSCCYTHRLQFDYRPTTTR